MSEIPLPSAAALSIARPEAACPVLARTPTRHYRIGPVPVSLTCRLPEIAADFHRYYAPYQVFAPTPDSFAIEVTPQRSRRSFRRYIYVRANGMDQCILRNTRSILPFIEWTMNALVARFLPGYLQIHAASLSHRGRGVILAGSPGQGKSTLAAALLASGWSYGSDEFALIDPRTRELHAYPKALCIKAGSFQPLLELGLPLDLDRVLHKGSKGPVSLLDPLSVRSDAVSLACPVRLIAFPEYAKDAAPGIEPMSRAQAVFEMVQASFNFTKFRNAGLEVLTAVAREARCVRIRSGALRQTCKLLEDELDRADAADGGGA